MLPRSAFTKRLTVARQRRIREAMRWMRPEQKAIAYRYGWDKGVRA